MLSVLLNKISFFLLPRKEMFIKRRTQHIFLHSPQIVCRSCQWPQWRQATMFFFVLAASKCLIFPNRLVRFTSADLRVLGTAAQSVLPKIDSRRDCWSWLLGDTGHWFPAVQTIAGFSPGKDKILISALVLNQGRKEMFHLTMHSTHFYLRLYDNCKGQLVKEENHCCHYISRKGSFICTIPQTG